MLRKKLNNKYTGVYRTLDEIDNLKIRVSLKKLYSIIQIPKFEKIQSSTSTDQPSLDFSETVELSWQEKIFSKTEIKYYEQKENCKSELEKQYHAIIKENPNAYESRLIFTYIDDDDYKPKDEFEGMKNRKSRFEDEMDGAEGEKGGTSTNSPLNSTSNNKNNAKFIKMYIMADLEPIILLFTIQYRKSDGLFLVYPDFNDSDNCYYLQIDQNSKQMFTFYMENISKMTSKMTKKMKQKQKINEIMSETCDVMRKMIQFPKDQQTFNFPKCRILLLIEILNAKNFEYDNIHVQYRVNLPKLTKLIDGQLEASTHSSFENEGVWNFGYCCSIVMDVENDFEFACGSIFINFDVISIDSLWLRERHEGTASLTLPLESSTSNIIESDLKCFRHINDGSRFYDFLERFFLGGLRSVNQNCHNQNGFNNLYGNTTLGTGLLKVRVQQIRQTQDSNFINARLKSVDEIIESYHKAKANLNV